VAQGSGDGENLNDEKPLNSMRGIKLRRRQGNHQKGGPGGGGGEMFIKSVGKTPLGVQLRNEKLRWNPGG